MNYFNYYTEIEEEFVKRRGSHMLVSPLDWSLMETWRQRGVPLNIVLRGINSSFDGYDQRVKRGRKINSLFYCQQEVEANFQEYCDSRVGAAGEADRQNNDDAPFSPKTIAGFLSEQLETLSALKARHSADAALNETFERVTLRLAQIIEDVQSGAGLSPETLEIDLTMIEEVILDGLKEAAGEDALDQLRQEGHQQLRAYRQSMEKEVYQQTLDNFIARRLRELYRIPRLSLFYM